MRRLRLIEDDSARGGSLFLDCANTHATCLPSLISPTFTGTTGASITGFNPVIWDKIDGTAATLTSDLRIKKELVGFAASGAHPGDVLEYKITLKNEVGGTITYAATPIFVADVIDYRLSLVEQSVVVTAGTVDWTGNRNMLWQVADAPGTLDVMDVFGYPLKAAINSSLFFQTEAGPRYIVGLQGGAKDPAQFGLGAVHCRVPNTNEAVGWDGGLGNL